jgi:hypothetical protein
VYPKLKQEYIFLIVKYKVPEGNRYNIKEYKNDGDEPEEKTFSESYQDQPGNEFMGDDYLCLKVIKKENTNFRIV